MSAVECQCPRCLDYRDGVARSKAAAEEYREKRDHPYYSLLKTLDDARRANLEPT